MKDSFIRLYSEHIKRDGAQALLDRLDATDFYTAPASTRFHGAYPGGLVEHSIHVYRRLAHLLHGEHGENIPFSADTIALCGLLHDVCKADFYAVSTRNVKNETTGRWEKQPYYTVDDRFPYGHGEKSVYLLQKFLRLSDEEAMAIRWHMGGFDEAVRGGSKALGDAFEKYPLALYLHLADMQATYLDEVKRDANESG